MKRPPLHHAAYLFRICLSRHCGQYWSPEEDEPSSSKHQFDLRAKDEVWGTGRWERATVSVCVVRFCAALYRILCFTPYPVIPTHWLPSWYQCHSCVVLRLESSRSYMPGRSSLLCHHHSRVCLCGRRGLSWSPEDEESYSLKHRLDLEVKGGEGYRCAECWEGNG